MKYCILITGSSGMLGIDLCEELRKCYNVAGVDLVRSPQSAVRSFRKGDITDRRGIERIISEIKPDVVIHTAAMTDVDGCELDKAKAYKINADGTENVALACKKIDAILIYISTDFVFDGKKKGPYKEGDKTNPISVYGDSKLKGEEAIKKVLKKYFILRTGWLYGRHGRNFVENILEKAKREKVLRIVNDQVGSPTYTKDLAKALGVLVDKILTTYNLQLTTYGIYHVSNSGSVSWYRYAKEILRLVKSKTPVTPISSEELARPALRPAMSVLDNSKFGRFAEFKMRHWKDALKEYLHR